MHRYAALLRGIAPSNPNMTNVKLRGVFEDLGFDAVASVLASGNIVFGATEEDVPALEARIQQALHEQLGIPGGTIIRSREQLQTLLDTDPFDGLTHGRGTYLTATFLKHTVPAPTDLPDDGPEALSRIVGYDAEAHAVLAVTDNSVPGKTPDFMARLEKAFGTEITTRTWLTVQRIVKAADKAAK